MYHSPIHLRSRVNYTNKKGGEASFIHLSLLFGDHVLNICTIFLVILDPFQDNIKKDEICLTD